MEVHGPRSAARRRVVAVDWSGSRGDRGATLYVAEVVDGGLRRLVNGLRRAEVTDLLAGLRAEDPHLVVGLDFAFSFPSWFLDQQGFASAADLWAADATVEAWLTDCPRPFWGRPGRPRHLDLPTHFRVTDLAVPAVGGIRPKSVFQIGGAGAVGTGSLRGFRELRRLREAGFAIWPFDPPAESMVVEIYPRILTGAVNKSLATAMRETLERRRWPEDPALRAVACAGADAFDATMSADAMWSNIHEFDALPAVRGRQVLMEGWIWCPGTVIPEDGVVPHHERTRDGGSP